MLHNDITALNRAKEIIEEQGLDAVVSDWYWIKNDNPSEDIFCYSLKRKNGSQALPGWDAPLFKRNGDQSDYIFPVFA